MTCIVQIWFERDDAEAPKPGPRFWIVETDFPDFDDFCDAVEGDGLIRGSSLWTRRGEGGGEQIIMSRSPCAFWGDEVRRFRLPTWHFVEDDQ